MRPRITDKTQRQKIISRRSTNVPPGLSLKNNFRSSSHDKKQPRKNIINSSARNNNYRKIECMTLEDCLLASPNLNAHPRIMGGHEIQIFKHLPSKVYPSSHSPDISQELFTPRRSFSERLGRIDESLEHDVDELSSKSSISRSGGSGKVRKKVTFRLPKEADIFSYYTPKDVFEE